MQITNLEVTRETQEKIINILKEVGVPPHLKGYTHLKTGLKLCLLNPDILDSMTKEFYPTVAEVHNTTSSRVERAIRHAIETAWDRGDLDTLQRIFGYTISSTKGKPTNTEFMAQVVEALRLQLSDPKQVVEAPKPNPNDPNQARLAQLKADLITLGVIKED